MKFPRIVAISVAVALAGVSLSGCSSANSSTAAGCTAPSSGDVSDSVVVSGDAGTAPTAVDFPTPLVATNTQATTVVKGTGEQLDKNSVWSLGYSLFVGTATTAVQSGGYAASKTTTPLNILPASFSTIPGLASSLSCGNVGDRIAIVLGTSDNSSWMSGLGLDTTSSVVMVVDVLAGFDGRATGSSESVSSVFPTVTLAVGGQPGISTPAGNAPTETTIGVLKKGSGAVVGDGDTAVVQYSGWLWAGGKQFDTSWGKGSAFSAAKGKAIDGFWKAIEGQTVGSQVIVIIPPKDGYGDTAQSTIPANSTLIFVIDILGIQ